MWQIFFYSSNHSTVNGLDLESHTEPYVSNFPSFEEDRQLLVLHLMVKRA